MLAWAAVASAGKPQAAESATFTLWPSSSAPRAAWRRASTSHPTRPGGSAGWPSRRRPETRSSTRILFSYSRRQAPSSASLEVWLPTALAYRVALSGVADTGRSRFGVCTDRFFCSGRMRFANAPEPGRLALAVFRLPSHPGSRLGRLTPLLAGGGSCAAILLARRSATRRWAGLTRFRRNAFTVPATLLGFALRSFDPASQASGRYRPS